MNFEDVHFLVRCLRYRWRTEKLPLKTLMLLDLKGATVIDIGANKGIYSFWLARAVGPSGKVLAFEPQPEMIRYIQRRKQCFGLANVETIEAALSDSCGTAQLTRQRVGDGSASLCMARDRSGNETVAVPLAILDDLALANPRFIKCDVEGHELSVFTGARRLIERCRPVVQFESVSADAGQLFAFFEELGYLGTMFLGNEYCPYTMGWQVPHPKFGLGGHRDFLFFPESAIGSTIPLPLYERIRTSAAASAVAGCPASSMPRARPAG
ncbi:MULTISPECIES: FkbM family methyltransferase [Bradyrhizobium]|uniref:FkbM family methyltransferase n=1 Tax=Bradyrhizobium TaxID=374 RepID=UPI000401A3DA|nr:MULTISPECIES: FkbM family methyltransferase [Bradyrhizobium]UFW45196.1 FkbM family methyltransferase [Bradyrhizobium arachidis]